MSPVKTYKTKQKFQIKKVKINGCSEHQQSTARAY
jgi:hypothetical protein